MEPSGRRKLFEILNRAKTEVEEQQASNGHETGSTISSSSENENRPRGVGRGKFYRPELLSKPESNLMREEHPRASTSFNHENGSVISEPSSSSQEPEAAPNKIDTTGDRIPLVVNYIPIYCQPNTSIFEYEVRFDPNIHSNIIRRSMLASVLKSKTPVFTFDGTLLYLPRKFPDDSTQFQAINRSDGSPVDVTLIFKHQKTMKQCIHFYNILFKQVMLKLEYVQFGQKMFDPSESKNIPHRQLTIWPGYVLACDEFDDGLMLMVDSSHRVLFDTKVSDLLRRIRMSCKQHPNQNFKDLVEKSLLGAVVLTPYNNKTYTIDDIDYDQTPLTTFKTRDGEISYVDYYKANYGVDIQDLAQPMLISYKERKMMAQNGQCQSNRLTVALIPELSQLTGLTDEMRSDKIVMRDIASYIRITPNQRVQAARKFIAKVNETPAAREILDNWGLRLSDELLKLHGRQLPAEKVKFGKDQFGHNKIISGITGDFGNQIGNSTLFEVIDLNRWILMYTRQDVRAKEEFLTNVGRCASGMGLTWSKPIEHMLPDDRNDTYANALRTVLRPDIQMAVFICPTSRDDRYAVIKKICCSENPIASQVINSRTLANQQKNRSIVQKILMQMNCKLGGSLWTVRIPFDNVMICGTDTYHSANKKSNSVGAFVASLNKTYTKWYSKATIQSNQEELLHGLAISMESALKSYKNLNGVLPDRIIFYRDGVGYGQFNLCREFEMPQLKQACRLLDQRYNPNITFIVVQKRVNTRIFMLDNQSNEFKNPPPGTVMDHSITRRGQFDFYLVSQNMRHGTATPSHYVVLENENGLTPDILQQLSNKLTYQYFNWPGSIRVPAPCQYAHKLAYLVGESIKRETAEVLNEKLFYL